MRVFSAPGKLVIAGEYAVVEGRPALVAAVDRRATCAVESAPVLQVSAVGMGSAPKGPCEAHVRGDEVWFPDDDTGAFGLTAAVISTARRHGIEPPRAHLVLDSSGFGSFDRKGEPVKLGLGSSASVAVALAAALYGSATEDDLPAIHRIADEAHRRFSSGRGSGIDVAAATFGGVFRFQRGENGRPPVVAPWTLCPSGLSLVVTFAGASTSTRAFLKKVEAFQAVRATEHLQSMQEIGRGTREFLDAATPDEDPRVFLAAVDRCRAAMQRLGERAGIDIVSAPHKQIARLAREHGGAAKPSGAGGGDVAIAFVPDDARAALEDALEEAGFPVIALGVGAVPGVHEGG